jgi:A/G-specific adenine glycosylase
MYDGCVARRESLQSVLPTPKLRKERPQRTAHAAIILRDDGAILLEHRPPAGIWGGLWTFPQFEEKADALVWMEQLSPRSGAASSVVEALPPYSHSFTHFDLTLHPLLMRKAQNAPAVAETDRYCWYDVRQPAKIGLAKPAVDLIRRLDASRKDLAGSEW